MQVDLSISAVLRTLLPLLAVIVLSSCLALSPPRPQAESGAEEERKLSQSQSKQVTWTSVRVNKTAAARASGTSQKIVPEQTDSSSEKLPSGMVLIPAGEFLMGSEEGNGDKDETPQRKVYLDAYYIDIHEVTNAQYHQFWTADGGEKSKHTPASYGSSYMIGDWPGVASTKPNYPVVGATWYDARAYAQWAGKRLPTEAEWEKAARGTEARAWPWGDNFRGEIVDISIHSNHKDGSDGYDNTTAPVGTYQTGVSPYGVHDMAGNVWEWVADWYDEGYYARSPAENPEGPDRARLKVARGGSWNNRQYHQRCVNRYYCYPDSWGNTLGFRCARSAVSDQ